MNVLFSFGSVLKVNHAHTQTIEIKSGARREAAQLWSSVSVTWRLERRRSSQVCRGFRMRIPSKSAVAGLSFSFSLLLGTELAADVCARAPDLVALQVAALQQQLMVAALTCDDVSLYNNFVTSYQKELQDSDAALLAFFDRFGEDDGAPAYHSFKTKMANLYSSRSAADKKRFCESARASFGPALKAEKKASLASFALSQPSVVNEPYTNCGQSVAGGAMLAGAPPAAAAPPRNLLTAQNAAAAATGAGAAAASSAADKASSAAVKTLEPATAAPSSGSAAVAAAGPNSAPPPRGQAANPNLNQERSAQSTAPNRYGYANQRAQAYWAERQRLAQERAARQRAAQRPSVRYRFGAVLCAL